MCKSTPFLRSARLCYHIRNIRKLDCDCIFKIQFYCLFLMIHYFWKNILRRKYKKEKMKFSLRTQFYYYLFFSDLGQNVFISLPFNNQIFELFPYKNASIFKKNLNLVKHSQYKNEATQLKNFFGLKLPPFFNWIASFLYWVHFNRVKVKYFG